MVEMVDKVGQVAVGWSHSLNMKCLITPIWSGKLKSRRGKGTGREGWGGREEDGDGELS